VCGYDGKLQDVRQGPRLGVAQSVCTCEVSASPREAATLDSVDQACIRRLVHMISNAGDRFLAEGADGTAKSGEHKGTQKKVGGSALTLSIDWERSILERHG
jgi:hypothetical protein